MNKEEYANLHYLLAKIKYIYAKDINNINLTKQTQNEFRKIIKAIETIEKIIIIDGKSEE